MASIAAFVSSLWVIARRIPFAAAFASVARFTSSASPRPRWELVPGATITDDVAPYERAKLRMLNGAHSALAYIGLQRGHSFVHEAVADPAIRTLIERLMLEEIAPLTPAPPGFDRISAAAAHAPLM